MSIRERITDFLGHVFFGFGAIVFVLGILLIIISVLSPAIIQFGVILGMIVNFFVISVLYLTGKFMNKRLGFF